MDKAKINLTQNGYDKLSNQLESYRARREPAVLSLQKAREMGDLSENGAYKAARFELSDIDRNIRRLERLLKYASVVSRPTSGVVGFGSVVKVVSEGKETTYELVSKHESDPIQNKLSVESPIGSSFLGKTSGDVIEINVPAGTKKYEILSVS